MPEPTRSERLASAYKRLAASADILNQASDEFAKPISELDKALQRLNLGLLTWHRVNGGEDDFDNYWRRDIGYARIGGKWGLALRRVTGNKTINDDESIEEWLFNDAPRSYRIEALDKLPDLLDQLCKGSDKTARKLKESTIEAQQLATALSQAAAELERQKKEQR
jgi:prefoldin subunit 5